MAFNKERQTAMKTALRNTVGAVTREKARSVGLNISSKASNCIDAAVLLKQGISILFVLLISVSLYSCKCDCSSECDCKKKDCDCKECGGYWDYSDCVCKYKSLYGDCGQSENSYKGRHISVSDLDKELFELLNTQRRMKGKSEIQFSKVIYDLLNNETISSFRKDSTLWKYFCSVSYATGKWTFSFSDTSAYKQSAEQSILYFVETEKDYSYGAVASQNNNGSWTFNLILLNSKKY